METKKWIKRIRDLIGEDHFKLAIEQLKQLLQKSKLLDDLIVQSSRYNGLVKQIHSGEVSFENADVSKTKIRYAITDILREIEEGIEENPKLEEKTDKALTKGAKNVNFNTITFGNGNFNNQIYQGNTNSNNDTNVSKL